MLTEVRQIELVEQKVGGLQLLVMADDAILIEKSALTGNVGGGSGGCRRGGLRWRRGRPWGGCRRRLPRARALTGHNRDRDDRQAPGDQDFLQHVASGATNDPRLWIFSQIEL